MNAYFLFLNKTIHLLRALFFASATRSNQRHRWFTIEWNRYWSMEMETKQFQMEFDRMFINWFTSSGIHCSCQVGLPLLVGGEEELIYYAFFENWSSNSMHNRKNERCKTRAQYFRFNKTKRREKKLLFNYVFGKN